MSKFSILVYHFAENDILEKFIENHRFAEDIVVINAKETQSFSTDKYPNVQTLFKPNYSAFEIEKMAFQKLRNDYFFYMKSTYHIGEDLYQEVQQLDLEENYCYYAQRSFHFMGEIIKFKNNETDWFPLLRNKNSNIFLKKKLKYPLYNNSYTDMDSYNRIMTVEQKFNAQKLFEKKKLPSFFPQFFLAPLSTFSWLLLLQGALFRGKRSVVLSYLLSFGVLKKYIQLWLMYNNLD